LPRDRSHGPHSHLSSVTETWQPSESYLSNREKATYDQDFCQKTPGQGLQKWASLHPETAAQRQAEDEKACRNRLFGQNPCSEGSFRGRCPPAEGPPRSSYPMVNIPMCTTPPSSLRRLLPRHLRDTDWPGAPIETPASRPEAPPYDPRRGLGPRSGGRLGTRTSNPRSCSALADVCFYPNGHWAGRQSPRSDQSHHSAPCDTTLR
jgi:hypothetical protein